MLNSGEHAVLVIHTENSHACTSRALQCLVNLPGLGALSYSITCLPVGPFVSDLGTIVNVDVDVNVFTPINVKRGGYHRQLKEGTEGDKSSMKTETAASVTIEQVEASSTGQ